MLKWSIPVWAAISITSTFANGNDPKPRLETSFEDARPGVFDVLKTEVGDWRPITGTTLIDDKHAQQGKQCLQLTGGTKTTVILDIAETADTTGDLTFWAERWTIRLPFSFRIEKRTPAGWSDLFNGDKQVRVGRAFLSNVKIPLDDDQISQLRFTVTSPAGTGVLIDQLAIAPRLPQQIVGAEVIPLTLPALVGTQASPLLKLKIETTGSRDPISITQVQAAIESQQGDLDSAHVYWTGATDRFDTTHPIGERKPIVLTPLVDPRTPNTGLDPEGNAELEFVGDQNLVEGVNYLWIAGTVSKHADITHQVSAVCRTLTFSDGKRLAINSAPTSQRLGVAVRNGGDDGVHTYRIPGLATTPKGTLIGVYDVRRRSGGDLPGDIDVGMSRSIDGGKTWQPMKTIMDMGSDPKWNYDGIGDPAVLVDQNTGTIWVAATWSHGNRSWRGSGQGLKPAETGQLMLVRSDDDGISWSDPINITSQIKKPEWCFILQGPGKGITMRDGTLVFAAQYQDPPGKNRLPHSTIIYSRDHGETWHVATGAFDDTTESQVIEVEPGILMLNCRYNRKSVRVVMTTPDMGATWHKHPTSERALIEPGACMASLIDVDRETGSHQGNWLLFSNPDSLRGRNHITVKASPDRGLTWPKQHRLLLDEGTSAGYSCMSMIDKDTVGILYEGSQSHMTFQRIPWADLVPRDRDHHSSQPGTPSSQGSISNLAAGKDRPPTQTATADPHPESPLSLPRVFGNHMVMQAEYPLTVWGTAKAGRTVRIQLGTEQRGATASDAGQWQVRFPARKATTKATSMVVQCGDERIQFTDILFGEVWVCAGQSNMEWPLSLSENGRHELANADHPHLRLLNLEGGASGNSIQYASTQLDRLHPDMYCSGNWEVANARTAGNFSAVGWYFGRDLLDQLKVPVGLICPAVGGTPTEAWIPKEALQRDPQLTGLVAGNWLDNPRMGDFCRSRGEQNLLSAIQSGQPIPGDEHGPNHPFKPGFMWSSAIKPLIPFAIRGVIWYQGESNAETSARAEEHSRLFPLLIDQWRSQWGQGVFPFLYVQLPALNREHWPLFRDTQLRCLREVEQVGMAVTLDTGHPSNVHPGLKKPIGNRLAAWALGTTYPSHAQGPVSGPLLDTVQGKGNQLRLSFQHTANGLKSSDEKPLRHFEVCGADGVFYEASASVSNRQHLLVSSPRVVEPLAARYAWKPYPQPKVNFVNSAGLPASPFSTQKPKAPIHHSRP